jgi:hypothetical protein
MQQCRWQPPGASAFDPQDLRLPLTTQWGGASRANTSATSIIFRRPGSGSLSVKVTDAEGVTAERSTTIDVSLVPLSDGQQPF